MNKSAVSLMISYVLLISIVIALSVGVFIWLKTYTNINPLVDCKEGTSMIIMNTSCDIGGGIFKIGLKNNGRFNVSGLFLAVGNNVAQIPTTYLIPMLGVVEGVYYFESPVKPGEETIAEFLNKKKVRGIKESIESGYTIKIVQIQPFISYKKTRVPCSNAVIKEEIEGCQIS